MNDTSDRCISYIYNEMDPSEQVEFERELEHDENLLIEVESLKKISERLHDDRLMDPPADLLESIYQKAAHTNGSAGRTVNWWRWGSAAAVLLISVSMSSYMLLPVAESDDEPESNENALMGLPSPRWSVDQEDDIRVVRETAEQGRENEVPVAQAQASSSVEQSGTPWVDNNDILRFGDRVPATSASQIDSIKTQSLKKLTPVDSLQERARMQHRLHLTGSNK